MNEENEPMEILHKSGIEKACLDENERKYRQTESTPCMTNPLRNLLGTSGDTPYCESILDGTFTPIPQMSNYTIEFFQELQRAYEQVTIPDCQKTTTPFKIKKDTV